MSNILKKLATAAVLSLCTAASALRRVGNATGRNCRTCGRGAASARSLFRQYWRLGPEKRSC